MRARGDVEYPPKCVKRRPDPRSPHALPSARCRGRFEAEAIDHEGGGPVEDLVEIGLVTGVGARAQGAEQSVMVGGDVVALEGVAPHGGLDVSGDGGARGGQETGMGVGGAVLPGIGGVARGVPQQDHGGDPVADRGRKEGQGVAYHVGSLAQAEEHEPLGGAGGGSSGQQASKALGAPGPAAAIAPRARRVLHARKGQSPGGLLAVDGPGKPVGERGQGEAHALVFGGEGLEGAPHAVDRHVSALLVGSPGHRPRAVATRRHPPPESVAGVTSAAVLDPSQLQVRLRVRRRILRLRCFMIPARYFRSF